MTVDSPYQDLLQRHTHAIIDWMSVVPEDWHRALPVRPLVPRFFRNTDEDIMPVLLTLDSLSETQLNLLIRNLENTETRPYMLIPASLLRVTSQTHPDSLAHHLTNMLMLDGRGREGANRLLRYHYASVFLHLLRIFPPKRIAQLFGPIQQWTIPFQKEWISFTPPQTTGALPQYWCVTEEREPRLNRIGIINDVLSRWRDKTGHRWESVEAFHADADKLEQLLVSGVRRYQLKVYEDQLLFGIHSLLYGENFHEHPKIRKILSDVQEKGWGYTAGCADVTEEDWETIAVARHIPATFE